MGHVLHRMAKTRHRYNIALCPWCKLTSLDPPTKDKQKCVKKILKVFKTLFDDVKMVQELFKQNETRRMFYLVLVNPAESLKIVITFN